MVAVSRPQEPPYLRNYISIKDAAGATGRPVAELERMVVFTEFDQKWISRTKLGLDPAATSSPTNGVSQTISVDASPLPGPDQTASSLSIQPDPTPSTAASQDDEAEESAVLPTLIGFPADLAEVENSVSDPNQGIGAVPGTDISQTLMEEGALDSGPDQELLTQEPEVSADLDTPAFPSSFLLRIPSAPNSIPEAGAQNEEVLPAVAIELPRGLKQLAELVHIRLTLLTGSLSELIMGPDANPDHQRLARVIEATLIYHPEDRAVLSQKLEDLELFAFEFGSRRLERLWQLLDHETFVPEKQVCDRLGVRSLADVDSKPLLRSDVVVLGDGTRYFDISFVDRLVEEQRLRALLDTDTQSNAGLAMVLGVKLTELSPYFVDTDGQPIESLEMHRLGEILREHYPAQVATVREILRRQGKVENYDFASTFSSVETALMFGCYDLSSLKNPQLEAEWFLENWTDTQIGRHRGFDGIRYAKKAVQDFLMNTAVRINLLGPDLHEYARSIGMSGKSLDRALKVLPNLVRHQKMDRV